MTTSEVKIFMDAQDRRTMAHESRIGDLEGKIRVFTSDPAKLKSIEDELLTLKNQIAMIKNRPSNVSSMTPFASRLPPVHPAPSTTAPTGGSR